MAPRATGPLVVTSGAAAREAVRAARGRGLRVGLVPTMGALHAGHLSLVSAACRACEFVVVTIFVNPTQFGPAEDFEKYPRSLDADLAAIAAHQVDLVFAPPVEEMYAAGHATRIEVEGVAAPMGVAAPLEGICRPGHFSGVATVVLKLFLIVPADVAYFGQKDYQQALVVRQMVADLNVPIDVQLCPTVREADGLALSSRNAYLSDEERVRARAVPHCLQLAADLIQGGQRDAAVIIRRMRELLTVEGQAAIDYATLVDPETLAGVTTVSGPTLATVAAHIGNTRLIDNRLID